MFLSCSWKGKIPYTGPSGLSQLPQCRIYVSVNWASIGSGNGLLPVQCLAITWTNTDLLLIGPLWTNFREIKIKIQIFSFMKMHMKTSAKWQLFCLGWDELMHNFSFGILNASDQISSAQWYQGYLHKDLKLSLCHLCHYWWHWRLSSTYGAASEEWWQIKVSSVQMPWCPKRSKVLTFIVRTFDLFGHHD